MTNVCEGERLPGNGRMRPARDTGEGRGKRRRTVQTKQTGVGNNHRGNPGHPTPNNSQATEEGTANP